MLPGCIVFALPFIVPLVRKASQEPAILINAVPLCVLIAMWLLMVFSMRRRTLQKIQRELEVLDGLTGNR